MIDEQGFQRSSLTEDQMVRIGEILNVSKIVVGDVNIAMGQYNVDVRVVNVEGGTIAATEGATFAGTSYRETMKSLAQKLAAQIAIGEESIVSPQPAPTPPAPTPIVLYGYLKVFPNDLGTFDAEPHQVISRLNQSQQFGYGSWRLPTNEELALMRANNLIGSGDYMTRENKNRYKLKAIVRLVTTETAGYVDLGLPSGTLWKTFNEGGNDCYFTYHLANSEFSGKLPTMEQFFELCRACEWIRIGDGYKVVGPNGNYITFPAAGFRGCDGDVNGVGFSGYYWSSTPSDSDFAWNLYFDSSGVINLYDFRRCCGLSVRLVK